jgi:hypothetical protein
MNRGTREHGLLAAGRVALPRGRGAFAGGEDMLMRREFLGQLLRRAERVPAQVSFSLTLQKREVRAETYAEPSSPPRSRARGGASRPARPSPLPQVNGSMAAKYL